MICQNEMKFEGEKKKTVGKKKKKKKEEEKKRFAFVAEYPLLSSALPLVDIPDHSPWSCLAGDPWMNQYALQLGSSDPESTHHHLGLHTQNHSHT